MTVSDFVAYVNDQFSGSVEEWLCESGFSTDLVDLFKDYSAEDMSKLTKEDVLELTESKAVAIKLFNRIHKHLSTDGSSVAPFSPSSSPTNGALVKRPAKASAKLLSLDLDHPETISPASVSRLMFSLSSLMRRYVRLTPVTFHKSIDGEVQPCCATAFQVVLSDMRASSYPHGISGVLADLQRWFKWGSSRANFVCEAVRYAASLDCGASASLAVQTLRETEQHKSQQVIVAGCQLVYRVSSFESDLWAHVFQEAGTDPAWTLTIENNDALAYHQCVALLTPDAHQQGAHELRIWDWGKWHLPPVSLNCVNAILGLRIESNGVFKDELSALPIRFGPLTFPAGQLVDNWCTLLPSELAISAFPNVAMPKLFSPEAPLALPASVSPFVFVSGCGMNNDNPSPGVGVARSIRSYFPAARLIGVDYSELSNGLNDPVFDDCLLVKHSLPSVSPSVHFGILKKVLAAKEGSFFLPCADVEVYLIAQGLEEERLKDPASYEALKDRFLLPSLASLHTTTKPGLEAGELLDMLVPEFILVDASSVSVQHIHSFCSQYGYPVYVKGLHFGANLCLSWLDVQSSIVQLTSTWNQNIFVQRCVTGFQMGIAFAAYEGELIDYSLLTKTVSTSLLKGWAGLLSDLPDAKMLARVKKFVKETKWTGGGEIEYVNTLDGQNFLIDFNARFPAWIHSSTLAGINLPGSFVHHALRKVEIAADPCSPLASLPLPTPKFERKPDEPLFFPFTRTISEVVDTRLPQHLTCGSDSLPGYHSIIQVGQWTGVANAQPIPVSFSSPAASLQGVHFPPIQFIPPHIQKFSEVDEAARKLAQMELQEEVEKEEKGEEFNSVAALQRELAALCPTGEVLSKLPTPAFVLSKNTVIANIQAHQKCLSALASSHNIPRAVIGLSVKTQPSPVLLKTAKENGCLGEVISLAELRSALDAGFSSEEIIVNGPAKFVDHHTVEKDYSLAHDKEETLAPLRNYSSSSPLKVFAIFADSLAELEMLIKHMTSPGAWLEAGIVGIRLCPVGGFSRFGIRQYPELLARLPGLFARLPASVKFGVHFHYASSTLGINRWFAHASAVVHMASFVAKVVGREVSMMDFGGGWNPHTFTEKKTQEKLNKLFDTVNELLPHVEVVAIEPGKSISERAGAIITRVQHVRENIVNPCDLAASSVSAVLDACICDLGSLVTHPHPVLLYSSEKQPEEEKEKGSWAVLGAGKDELYGRICMEWDKLNLGLALPRSVKKGDALLLAFTGAYDMSMSYGFGRGILSDHREVTKIEELVEKKETQEDGQRKIVSSTPTALSACPVFEI